MDESQRISPPNAVPSTSTRLLQLARGNDPSAWREVLQVYGPVVRYWLRQAGLSSADVPDVFQNVFLAVSKNLRRFQPEAGRGSFRKWLKTITNSKVADHYRKAGRQENADGGSLAAQRMSAVPDGMVDETVTLEPAKDSDESVMMQQVMQRIRGEFSDMNWQAFWRTTVDGRTATEAAEQLGASPAAVRKAKSRVLARLRAALADYDT